LLCAIAISSNHLNQNPQKNHPNKINPNPKLTRKAFPQNPKRIFREKKLNENKNKVKNQMKKQQK
jgi:hypothetical protein